MDSVVNRRGVDQCKQGEESSGHFRTSSTMLKFLKNVVGSAGGIKDLPYVIGEPYSSAWGSWTHYRGTSKVSLLVPDVPVPRKWDMSLGWSLFSGFKSDWNGRRLESECRAGKALTTTLFILSSFHICVDLHLLFPRIHTSEPQVVTMKTVYALDLILMEQICFVEVQLALNEYIFCSV